MGFLDDAKDKLGAAVDSQGDKIGEGLDKVGDLIDEKTGGQYAEQVDQAQEIIKAQVHSPETPQA